MTSKVSFFKLIQESIRKRIWAVCLAMIVYFLALPVTIMLVYENLKRYSDQEAQSQFLMRIFSESGINSLLLIVVIFGAVICGFSSFSYLLSKKQVDLYHSLPVKRVTWFASQYLAGFLIYLVPFVINMLISLVFIISQVGLQAEVIGLAVTFAVKNSIYFIMIYHVTILAVMLTGNVINFIVMEIIIGVYSGAVYLLGYGYMMAYMTSFYYTSTVFEKIGIWLAPFANIFYVQRVEGQNVAMEHLQLFLLAVILLFVSVWLYRKRPSEAATNSLAFPKMIPVVRTVVVIPTAIASGIFFHAASNVSSAGWLVFGIVFGGILSHVLLEVLYNMTIRHVLAHKIYLAGACVVSILLAFSVYQDWWGYNQYLPNKESIASMGIQVGSFSDWSMDNLIEEDIRVDYTSHDRLRQMNLTDIDVVYEIASLGVYSINQIDEDLTFEEVFYRSGRTNDIQISFDVRYTLSSGKIVYRSYRVGAEDVYQALSDLYRNEEYIRVNYKSTLELPAQNIRRISVIANRSAMYDNVNISYAEELMEAYQLDMMNATFGDYTEENACGKIEMEISERNGSNYFINEINILPSYINMLAVLEKAGIDLSIFQVISDDVQMISVRGFGEPENLEGQMKIMSSFSYGNYYMDTESIPMEQYVSEMGYGYTGSPVEWTVEISEEDEIKELIQVLDRPSSDYENREFRYYNEETPWRIEVTYMKQEGDMQTIDRESYILYSNHVPEFLKEKVWDAYYEAEQQN